MSQLSKAREFAALHAKGAPLILYNAWDSGSAKAIIDAGAKAIATSSWSVAAAQGFKDGEDLPLAFAEQIVERIVATLDADALSFAALQKDAPVSRPVQRTGVVRSRAIPGGLHHHYARA